MLLGKNTVFGDNENLELKLAERMLEVSSFKEILYTNNLSAVEVLEILIRNGFIDTSYFEDEPYFENDES